MTLYSRPPETQASVKPFDPLAFARSVIAIPLLREMEEEIARIQAFKAGHIFDPLEFNALIEYNKAYPGTAEEIRELVVEMANRAATGAMEASKKRLQEVIPTGKPIPDDGTRDRAEIYGDVPLMEQRRHKALEDANRKQKIGPLRGEGSYSFANLHGSVIRRLLAANDRLAASEPGVKPIIQIHPTRYEIIIDLNLEYPGGREAARRWVFENIEQAKESVGVRDAGQDVHLTKDQRESTYVFARLEARVIKALIDLDIAEAKTEARNRGEGPDNLTGASKADPSKLRAIYRVWPDFEISAYINKSIATVKADAAQNSFSAHGAGITWAVMDSGIKHDHEHFRKYNNVDANSEWHKDFTVDGGGPFDDENGHGTHVAGIIAGEWRIPNEVLTSTDLPPPTGVSSAPRQAVRTPIAVSRYLKKDSEDVEYQPIKLVEGISGMAPRCKLVSLRVLDENGKGSVSNLIAAIGHVQEINGYGRRILIHGVNISVGYAFEPEWFACGQSPLCVEVDRLVKTGVVVVVAAGNTGYGTLKSTIGASAAGMALTINDPGNSDLAITVGSTHRHMPHVYGVSYFSSKGPTGDGRLKPDIIAPGEKIISCATGNLKREGARGIECDYVETSGTSMAAPHVSGTIAAFLSVRIEFIGKAERVKDIFLASATDLRRDRYFQGAGLVDLMRAIQSV